MTHMARISRAHHALCVDHFALSFGEFHNFLRNIVADAFLRNIAVKYSDTRLNMSDNST